MGFEVGEALIENALRHTPNGAKVSLSLAHRDRGPFAEVGDNGPGIPENERRNVFKALLPAGTQPKHARKRTGLALVAAIADLHTARIELVDTEPGLKVTLQFKD